MEGISHEACSLAGTLGLGKLICFYDDNGISIDGKVEGWFTDDTAKRFEAYGWHVIPNVDGQTATRSPPRSEAAQAETGRPSLICCKTDHRLWRADQAGHARRTARRWEPRSRRGSQGSELAYEPFVIPDASCKDWDCSEKGAAAEQAWQDAVRALPEGIPDLAAEFERRMQGELPKNWRENAPKCLTPLGRTAAPQATRQSSQAMLNAAGTRAAGTLWRLGGPDRLRTTRRPRTLRRAHAGRLRGQLHALRRARIRHDAR